MRVKKRAAWRQTNRQKDRRRFTSARPLPQKKQGHRHALSPLGSRALFRREEYEHESFVEKPFDPVQRDPFFVLIKDSKYWPPSETTKERLRHTTSIMETYHRSEDTFHRKIEFDLNKRVKAREKSLNKNDSIRSLNKTSEMNRVNLKKNQRDGRLCGVIRPPVGIDISSRRTILGSSDTENKEKTLSPKSNV